jgi:phenylacetate-CoA ligase
LGIFRSRNISRFDSPEQQLRELQRFRPTVVWGYATVARTLLPLVDDQLDRIMRPRLYINAGEVLDPHLRARLRESLGADMTDLYGSTEVGIIAAGCSARRGLHVHADAVVLECLGNDGAATPDERGAAVVTCLGARAMPMIRYRVGDLFRWLDGPCPCGSAMPLMQAPIGREADALRLPGGRRLYPGECEAFVGRREVLQYRFTQEAPQRVRVEVVLRHEAARADLAALRARVAACLGDGVEATLEVLEAFPDRAIKFRTFVGERAAMA